MDSRGRSYLTLSKLFLHSRLLCRFGFKNGGDGASHSDQPLVEVLCLGVIELYGLLLALTLQTVTNALLWQSTARSYLSATISNNARSQSSQKNYLEYLLFPRGLHVDGGHPLG